MATVEERHNKSNSSSNYSFLLKEHPLSYNRIICPYNHHRLSKFQLLLLLNNNFTTPPCPNKETFLLKTTMHSSEFLLYSKDHHLLNNNSNSNIFRFPSKRQRTTLFSLYRFQSKARRLLPYMIIIPPSWAHPQRNVPWCK